MGDLVITGAGVVTSIGQGRVEFFEALCRGASGLGPLAYFEPRLFKQRSAYEIAGQVEPMRSSRLLGRAVRQALQDAGVEAGAEGMVVVVGTGLRELRSVELWHAGGAALRPERLHFADAMREDLGFAGLTLTLSNACAASSFALGVAEDLLELGEAERVLVAGCDTLTESMFGMLDRVNPVGLSALRPFGAAPKGVLMGDGAAAVVLERRDAARARGRSPLGVVKGVGMNCDAYNATAPRQDGIEASMREAQRRARIAPPDVDLLVAHGTGTEQNDRTEALAIREVFGRRRVPVPVTGLKSMVGHTSGASGLVGVVAALEAMRRSLIPATAYVSALIDEARDLDLVTGEARAAEVRVAQVNAFGFGGLNAVVILERPPDGPGA
ncbi:MAG: 3-oxoacyl-ACP synthase [Acidobacteria bacterium]|nr:MAG: 3-oxoacyl-ACP synthase [Acidobacteriota bacterium]